MTQKRQAFIRIRAQLSLPPLSKLLFSMFWIALLGISGNLCAAGYHEGFDDPGRAHDALHGVLILGREGDWTGHIEGGVYLLENRGEDTSVRYMYVLPGKDTWDDPGDRVSVEVGGTFAGEDYPSGAGLIFRLDRENRHYLAFVIQDGNSYGLYRRDEEGLRVVMSGSHHAIKQPTNELSILMRGNDIDLRINGEKIGSYGTSAIQGNGVGLIAIGSGRFEYDNFSLPNAETKVALAPAAASASQTFKPEARRLPPRRPSESHSEPKIAASAQRVADMETAPELPGGYQLLTDPGVTGGHLVATRPGTGSATDLLAHALNEVDGFFQNGPEVVAGFRDAEDRRAEAVFRAKIQGSPIGGIAYAVVGRGTGTNGFVFDSPRTLRRTIPQLMQLSGYPGTTTAAPALQWRDTQFPDGSGWMQLPEGWVITFSDKGMVAAEGPHGFIERGVWTPVTTRAAASQLPSIAGMPIPGLVFDPIDPVSALQAFTEYQNRQNQQRGIAPWINLRLIEAAQTQPVPGYSQAAFIDYEFESSGRGYRSIAFVMLGDVSVAGTWVLYTTYVASPSETFPENLPVLLRIWGSSRTAQHVLKKRIEDAMESLRKAGEIYRQSRETGETSHQRMHHKWIEVIQGTRIIEDILTGERQDTDLGLAKEIVRTLNELEGHGRYRQIPLWQLRE